MTMSTDLKYIFAKENALPIIMYEQINLKQSLQKRADLLFYMMRKENI